MDILFLIGRIIYGGFFLLNGINHFTKSEALRAYAAGKGVKNPAFSVFFSGLLIFVGGLGIILGIYIPIAVAALILFLVSVSFRMHDFWKIQDEQMKVVEMAHFLKNMALAGAALMILNLPQPWVLSL